MVVRVKLKIMKENKIIESSALANSGYEAETPQLLIPIKVAEQINLWPIQTGYETIFETAGGPLKVWVIPKACIVKVISEDTESHEIKVDIVISQIADEILLSDKLIGELQLALEDVGRGLWRFRWEPKEKVRYSEPPKYWR
ncbi:MAG: hypothetical protein N3E39_00095 [Candidatus Methanomethylicia archaeon]|nr:hypothetical protein [Candidatus Methanomethylicia archaeon]